jgi:anaphase-promoting complex subunit 1
LCEGDRPRCYSRVGIDVSQGSVCFYIRPLLQPITFVFLQSHNTAVASRLALPDTHFLLDYVRPDLLMLRVVSRSLVLWDNIEPSIDWVTQQIPAVVLEAFEKMGAKNSAASDYSPEIDAQTIRQAHANIVAGACLAIGLRFAGSAHLKAHQVLLHFVGHFRWLRDSERDRVAIAKRPERPILEMCLATTAQALALVMAGTGELKTLRLLRELRWRVDGDVTFGNHMALNMAIGLLFLGGGSCTIGRDNRSIAALVAALYPRYPLNTTDNRYHLQAFRHLYVLAVEPRCVEVVDVDTGAPCYVPLEVTLAVRYFTRFVCSCSMIIDYIFLVS